MPSPACRPPIWIRSRWWSSPARCPATPSARTPSRSATRSASPVRWSSTTSSSRTSRIWRKPSRKPSSSPAPAVPAPCWSTFRRISRCTRRRTRIRKRSRCVRTSRSIKVTRARSARPMIYTGGGVILANASPELNRFVDKLGFPVTNTLMGLGAYRASSENYVGMPGMHGTYEANMAMQHCDVLIAIGARFDDRVIGNPKHFASHPRKIIHVDIDPSSISKRVKVDIPIVGNVKDVLIEFLAQLDASEAKPNAPAVKDWWKQIQEWRGRDCLKFPTSDLVIKPQSVVQKVWDITKGDAFITSDVGQHQMWAAQYYGFDKPRRWINSGGLGTMGVGLPYAMGVQMANPDATVACITGEGSIQMCIQELATCKQYHLTPKIIMLNNRFLGMVRQWQQIDYGSRYSESYMDSLPNFEKLAEAYGHVGMRIEKPGDVGGAMRDAFAMKDKLVFMNFITDQSENVWPMVKAGCGLSEMLLGSEDL